MNDGELISTAVNTEEERALKAYNYRLSGAAWPDVRDKLQYTSIRKAKEAVTRLVAKAAAGVTLEQREEVLNMELDRLDALQEAVWGIAMTGDTKAVDSVLKIMSHRSKLLRLENENTSSVNTIVVTSDNYAKTLQEITDL